MKDMTGGLVAVLLAAVAIPAGVAQAPDWWLVYGDRAREASFVDLATLREGAGGTRVTMLVDRAGSARRSAITVDCAVEAAAPAAPAGVPAFVCGCQAYRDGHGLDIRDIPPAELARLHFQG